MGLNIFNFVLVFLVIISCVLLFPSLIARWYFVEFQINSNVESFSFYASKIVKNGINYEWSDFPLSKTREIIRASLAFSVISFVFGVFSLITVTRHFKKIMMGTKMISIAARVMLIVGFLFTIISISIIPGGISKAFTEDYNYAAAHPSNSTSPNSISNFNYCINGCEETFKGETKLNGIDIRFGPGICWYVVAFSLIPQFLVVPMAIYAFFTFQYKTSAVVDTVGEI